MIITKQKFKQKLCKKKLDEVLLMSPPHTSFTPTSVGVFGWVVNQLSLK
jgi:hypothetical protein